MIPFLEPSLPLLAFLFAKTFLYAQLVLILALARAVVARGPARAMALLCALFAGAITFTVFAPALNLTGQAWYPWAARALNHTQGMAVLLTLSAFFGATALLPGTRHRWIDWVHGLLLLGLLGLWIATMF